MSLSCIFLLFLFLSPSPASISGVVNVFGSWYGTRGMGRSVWRKFEHMGLVAIDAMVLPPSNKHLEVTMTLARGCAEDNRVLFLVWRFEDTGLLSSMSGKKFRTPSGVGALVKVSPLRNKGYLFGVECALGCGLCCNNEQLVDKLKNSVLSEEFNGIFTYMTKAKKIRIRATVRWIIHDSVNLWGHDF